MVINLNAAIILMNHLFCSYGHWPVHLMGEAGLRFSYYHAYLELADTNTHIHHRYFFSL